MKKFFSFIKEQGLALAIGFIMGSSVSKIVYLFGGRYH